MSKIDTSKYDALNQHPDESEEQYMDFLKYALAPSDSSIAQLKKEGQFKRGLQTMYRYSRDYDWVERKKQFIEEKKNEQLKINLDYVFESQGMINEALHKSLKLIQQRITNSLQGKKPVISNKDLIKLTEFLASYSGLEKAVDKVTVFQNQTKIDPEDVKEMTKQQVRETLDMIKRDDR